MSPTIYLSVKEEVDRVVIGMMKSGDITVKKADEILDLIRVRIPELPTSIRSVLRRCNDVEPKILESGTHYYLGLKSSLLRTSENWLRKTRFTELKLQLNYDGLSLFKISNQQPWPVLCRITSLLVSNVFIVGIYGSEVEPSDFKDMSAALITELHELLTVGINVDKFQVHLTVKLVAVICDALALSNVRHLVGQNATTGCDKFQALGTRMGGRMTFPNGEHDLRSDVTFRSRSQSIHHRGRSSFENLPVDMIKCFPSELMHMIYLGVTKKLILLWKQLAIK
ncbi:unnamed protein product [Schistosoma mattheei]|uniref:Uncharacterized protein n=1 Tax=Schistosoma mattheei TaxID=31246 RepID=A0A183PVS9_9TREM|nr:unnamed protein product [Schistosoma mattheei]